MNWERYSKSLNISHWSLRIIWKIVGFTTKRRKSSKKWTLSPGSILGHDFWMYCTMHYRNWCFLLGKLWRGADHSTESRGDRTDVLSRYEKSILMDDRAWLFSHLEQNWAYFSIQEMERDNNNIDNRNSDRRNQKQKQISRGNPQYKADLLVVTERVKVKMKALSRFFANTHQINADCTCQQSTRSFYGVLRYGQMLWNIWWLTSKGQVL